MKLEISTHESASSRHTSQVPERSTSHYVRTSQLTARRWSGASTPDINACIAPIHHIEDGPGRTSTTRASQICCEAPADVDETTRCQKPMKANPLEPTVRHELACTAQGANDVTSSSMCRLRRSRLHRHRCMAYVVQREAEHPPKRLYRFKDRCWICVRIWPT